MPRTDGRVLLWGVPVVSWLLEGHPIAAEMEERSALRVVSNTASDRRQLRDEVGNRTQLTDTVVPEGTFGAVPNDPNTPNPLPTVNRTQAVTSTPGPLPSDGRSDVGTTPPNPTIPQRPALGGSYNQTVSYTYDKLYQLKDVAVAGGSTTSYTYDKVGNRATKSSGGFSCSYDKSDRVTGVTQGGVTTGYTFDNNGNLTNRGGLGAGGETYAYDRANRLISATIGTTAATTYAYDADGKRVSATVSGQVTSYLYDVNRGLPVLLSGKLTEAPIHRIGTSARRYVWGQGLAYAVSGSGATLEVDVYHPDGLGSVRAQTDSSGAIVQTYQTDEFGNPTLSDGTRNQPFGFTGEQRDAATGLIYLRARMYDPSIGRFMQRDARPGARFKPLSLNRFVYGLNSPPNRIGPSGFDSMAIAKAICTIYGWTCDDLTPDMAHELIHGNAVPLDPYDPRSLSENLVDATVYLIITIVGRPFPGK
ncbi:MAG: RHS repeat-associated core domain-containing protein [Chloroflexota bacterium]